MESGGISKRDCELSQDSGRSFAGRTAIVTVVASMIFAAMTGAGAATTGWQLGES